jgi:hypothetical protein
MPHEESCLGLRVRAVISPIGAARLVISPAMANTCHCALQTSLCNMEDREGERHSPPYGASVSHHTPIFHIKQANKQTP